MSHYNVIVSHYNVMIFWSLDMVWVPPSVQVFGIFFICFIIKQKKMLHLSI